MDTQTIVFIVLAFCFGGALVWLLSRRGSKTDEREMQSVTADLQNRIEALQNEKEALSGKISEAERAAQDMLQKKEQALKSKYEVLLQQIKDENARLDTALKLASEGKIEESVQLQLLEAGKSAETIRDLRTKLDELHSEHAALIAEYEPIQQALEVTKTESEKLSKRVKTLEEELDEAEDESASLEKKLKSKTQELQEVSEELDKTVRDNKHLKSELEQRDNELANRLEELKRKSDSISFVQDILSAPETKALDVKELYRSIDFFESFIRGQFMDCNAYLYNTYPSLSFNDVSGRDGFVEKKKFFLQLFEEWASVKRKSWLDKKTTIAFVGEFSAGKTSIVNRILSQDNPNIPLLPVSTKATTAIPTYIAGGEAERYDFVTPNDKLKLISEEVFKKVSKEILDEIKGVSSLIKYFVMTYKNPNLNGLSILDTPGFNSNDVEDKERTIDVINECDALFWVFDVNAGTINRSSISLIKEKLNKPLVVVINKVDTKSTSEVDKVEALIRKTLSEAGLTVEKFIRFSAKAPLKDIMEPIRAIRHDASRDEFVGMVGEDIKQLMELLNSGVKDAEKEYQKCSNKTNQITDKYNKGMDDLWNACNTAAGIPHWETHMFSSDRYEMSQGEGQRLMDLLEEIATTRSTRLAEIYNEEIQAVADAQQAYSNLLDLKASWQKVNDCFNEYGKTTKQLR